MTRKSVSVAAEVRDEARGALMNDAFVDRLRLVIERTTGGSVGGFAQRAQMPPTTIHKYLRDGSEPSRWTLIKLAATAGVSVGWLAAGEGGTPGGDDPDIWECPFFDAELSAGSGREAWAGQTPTETLRLPGTMVRNLFRPRGPTIALRVAGESMEPTIRDGAVAIVDTSVQRIDSDGKVYALRVDNVLLIKRAHVVPGVGIRISGDNAASPSVQLDAADADRLAVLGRVCGVINAA